MRFKSKVTDGYQVFAVSGTNTVSFAVDAAAADTKDLLGFAVEQFDPQANERYFMPGFKVFRSVIPAPDETTTVSTNEHPIRASSGTISPPSRSTNTNMRSSPCMASRRTSTAADAGW